MVIVPPIYFDVHKIIGYLGKKIDIQTNIIRDIREDLAKISDKSGDESNSKIFDKLNEKFIRERDIFYVLTHQKEIFSSYHKIINNKINLEERISELLVKRKDLNEKYRLLFYTIKRNIESEKPKEEYKDMIKEYLTRGDLHKVNEELKSIKNHSYIDTIILDLPKIMSESPSKSKSLKIVKKSKPKLELIGKSETKPENVSKSNQNLKDLFGSDSDNSQELAELELDELETVFSKDSDNDSIEEMPDLDDDIEVLASEGSKVDGWDIISENPQEIDLESIPKNLGKLSKKAKSANLEKLKAALLQTYDPAKSVIEISPNTNINITKETVSDTQDKKRKKPKTLKLTSKSKAKPINSKSLFGSNNDGVKGTNIIDKSLGKKPCKFPFTVSKKIGEFTEEQGCVKGKTGDWCATEVKPSGYKSEWGYCNQDEK